VEVERPTKLLCIQVTGILTQGRPESEAPDGEWVTSYSVSYSQDAFKWSFVTGSGGSRRIFRGNSDAGTVRQNQLDPPLSARFIRLHVVEWRGRPSLRLELTGCQGKLYLLLLLYISRIQLLSYYLRMQSDYNGISARPAQFQHHILFICPEESQRRTALCHGFVSAGRSSPLQSHRLVCQET